MANKEHLQRLKQGVSVWNAWIQEHPAIRIDLIKADLRGTHLNGAYLYGADLKEALLDGADLREAILSKAHLDVAHLRGAHLRGAHFGGADLRGVDLSEANLAGADLRGIHLNGAHLNGAHLWKADCWSADFSGADFSGADLSAARLIEAKLNRATLTDAKLWATQRAGWAIQDIICKAVYWGEGSKKERIIYSPGEFERLYADKMKIVLHYEGGISPIEIATLPVLIQRIEATHPGCILRLQSVQEAPGGATVTLVIEKDGGRSPDELRTLKTDIEIVSQRAIRAQRALLEERGMRERAENKLQIMLDEIFPRMWRLTMGQSPSIQISGGTIYGNIVGDISGEKAQVHYTHNDLAALEALVSEMLTHRAELPLTSAERTQFEEKLNAIQEQLATQAPNHSLLREALHTVRHILEAGVAHVLVGQWLPLLHKLG